MEYAKMLNYLYGLMPKAQKGDLSRMVYLMERLGNPQNGLEVVHIAGTNGKGSTTTMLAAILQEAGYKTGKYTSPFIVDFRERIQIDNQMIPVAKFEALFNRIYPLILEMEGLGLPPHFFEVVTAMAFCYFAEEGCGVVCMEVGLGGRLDATNVLDHTLISIITTIGLDHTELLGNTLGQIAGEKGGIIKQNGTVVLGPGVGGGAEEVIVQIAQEQGNQVVYGDKASFMVREMGLTSNKVVYQEEKLWLPLAGAHQLDNLATVLAATKILRGKGFVISPEAIKKGLAAVRFPARLEQLGENPTFLTDGAHNPEGIRALVSYIDMLPKGNRVLLFGMLREKDGQEAVALLGAQFDHIVVSASQSPRAICPKELQALFAAAGYQAQVADNVEEAVAMAITLAKPGGVVMATGSLHFSSSVRGAFFSQDPH